MGLLSRGLWWPQPWKFFIEFIKMSNVCARSKMAHHRSYGLLHPLPIPSRPRASISMDFVTDLHRVDHHDMALVIVDWFSRMTHLLPCSKTISGEETADLFLKNVVRLHGVIKGYHRLVPPWFHNYNHTSRLGSGTQHSLEIHLIWLIGVYLHSRLKVL